MTLKPCHLCFACNRKFRANHQTAVQTANGVVYTHKECAAQMERAGEGSITAQPSA